jgi:hypothetical protein
MIIKEVLLSLRFNFRPYGYLTTTSRQALMRSAMKYIRQLPYCLLITFSSDSALASSDIQLRKTREENKNIKTLQFILMTAGVCNFVNSDKCLCWIPYALFKYFYTERSQRFSAVNIVPVGRSLCTATFKRFCFFYYKGKVVALHAMRAYREWKYGSIHS